MISLKQGGNLLILALLSLPSQIHAKVEPFDLDLKELQRMEPVGGATSLKKSKPARRRASAPHARGAQKKGDQGAVARYTVKRGDHIFKILMAHFGMSNAAAERMIPRILRINDIPDIRHLAVGQTILIPGKEEEAVPVKSAPVVLSQKPQALEAKGPAVSPGVSATVAQLPPSSSKKTIAVVGLLPPSLPIKVAPPLLAIQQASTSVKRTAPTAAVAPEFPVAPPAPQVDSWICSVTDKDTAGIVDAVLNALSVSWSKNRIIESSAPVAFSIRVDRYFDYRQAHYIVSIGESDPYNYTLIRLLEGAGYRVLRLSGGEDFETVTRKMFATLGMVTDFGAHPLPGGAISGFLVQPDDAGGRRVIISGAPADPTRKWLLGKGCGAK